MYKFDGCSQGLNAKFTVKDWLPANVKITENADPNKCSYSGYGIRYDSPLRLSIPNFDWELIWAHMLIIKIKIA